MTATTTLLERHDAALKAAVALVEQLGDTERAETARHLPADVGNSYIDGSVFANTELIVALATTIERLQARVEELEGRSSSRTTKAKSKS